MRKKAFLLNCMLWLVTSVHGQLTASFSTSVNTICDGIDCDYEGPSILINELMISPVSNDGSLFENGNERQGEWIELYNPDVCEPVDISCYYLGNNATDGYELNKGAGFRIPQGTVIPPGGFCLIRGKNAAAVPAAKLVQNGGNVVEIVTTSSIVCMQGIRLWFPNAGGWFAFYDSNGVPQDAVSWGNLSNISNLPCVAYTPTCTGGAGMLSSYSNIPSNRKQNIYGVFPDGWGQSIRRIPDGGPWAVNSGANPPTPADCNANCAQLGTSTCDGTATINVQGGTAPYTYLWDDSQAQTTQTAVDLCTGTYTVRVTDAAGNVTNFNVEIEEFIPTVTFDMDVEVCNDGQMIPFINYSPTPTGTQTGEFTGAGVQGNAFNVEEAGEGSFTVSYTFTDENSCTQSAEGHIKVNPTPEAAISGLEASYCLSDLKIPVTTSPTGGTLTGPGIVNNLFNVELAGVGTHILKYAVTNSFGCSDMAELEVKVLANPQFTVAKVDSTCGENKGEISFNVNAGQAPYQYSVDGGNTFHNSNTFTELGSGNHHLMVKDANGCTSAATEKLFSFPLPDVSAPENINVCVDEFVTLNAINPDNIPITWNNGVQNGVQFMPPQSGSTVYAVHAELGICSITDEVTVTVHKLPPVSAGIDFTICKGENITLNGVGAYTYEWNQNVVNGQSFAPNATATYVLTGTSFWGCEAKDSVTISVNPIPEPSFVGSDLEGCEPHIAHFINTSNWPGTTVCEWTFGDGTTAESCDGIAHKYTSSGMFDVSLAVTDMNGCTGYDTIKEYVNVFPTPKASFYPDPFLVEMSATLVNFFNTTHGGTNFVWDFGTETPLVYTKHATHTYPDEKEGYYNVTLIATNDFGCIDSAKMVIEVVEDVVLYVPNSFTPDGDVYNPEFKPIFTQGYDYNDFVMYVFDRWGELVFETHDVAIGWDGTYGTGIVKEGTYVWKIEFGTSKSEVRVVKHGHVNLLR